MPFLWFKCKNARSLWSISINSNGVKWHTQTQVCTGVLIIEEISQGLLVGETKQRASVDHSAINYYNHSFKVDTEFCITQLENPFRCQTKRSMDMKFGQYIGQVTSEIMKCKYL